MVSVCFVNCSDIFTDTGVNKWRWDWTDIMVDEQRIGQCIRKITSDGHAFCVRCSKEINYSSKGKTALEGHLRTKTHIASVAGLKGNSLLPRK